MKSQNIYITLYPYPPNQPGEWGIRASNTKIHKATVIAKTKTNDVERGGSVFHGTMPANTRCTGMIKLESFQCTHTDAVMTHHRDHHRMTTFQRKTLQKRIFIHSQSSTHHITSFREKTMCSCEQIFGPLHSTWPMLLSQERWRANWRSRSPGGLSWDTHSLNYGVPWRKG